MSSRVYLLQVKWGNAFLSNGDQGVHFQTMRVTPELVKAIALLCALCILSLFLKDLYAYGFRAFETGFGRHFLKHAETI